MIHTDMPNKKIHQGRNIKRFREMLGIKQDALTYELGEDWNQKKISLLEQKESSGYLNCTFNPLDKMVELYERMLKQQQDMIEKLERLIEGK